MEFRISLGSPSYHDITSTRRLFDWRISMVKDADKRQTDRAQIVGAESYI